jgi:hypothetical protein
MFVAPWFCSDRDGEMVHGEKLTIAITAPNVPMADRRFNIAVDLATSERFMIVSLVRAVADQRQPFSDGSADLVRWRSNCRCRERFDCCRNVVTELTADGLKFLIGLGTDLTSPPRSRRTFCRPCLDWSERRPHLAGRVGASLANLAFERDRIRRRPQGRSVEITGHGIAAFRTLFDARI